MADAPACHASSCLQAFIELQEAHQQREELRAEVSDTGCWPAGTAQLLPFALRLPCWFVAAAPHGTCLPPALQLRSAQEAAEAAQQLAQQLQGQRDELQAALAAQQAAAEQLREEVRQMQAVQAELQGEVQRASVERAGLQGELQRLMAQQADLQEELQRSMAQQAELQARLASADAQVGLRGMPVLAEQHLSAHWACALLQPPGHWDSGVAHALPQHLSLSSHTGCGAVGAAGGGAGPAGAAFGSAALQPAAAAALRPAGVAGEWPPPAWLSRMPLQSREDGPLPRLCPATLCSSHLPAHRLPACCPAQLAELEAAIGTSQATPVGSGEGEEAADAALALIHAQLQAVRLGTAGAVAPPAAAGVPCHILRAAPLLSPATAHATGGWACQIPTLHAATLQAAGLEAQLAEAAAEQERLRQLCSQLEAQVCGRQSWACLLSAGGGP